MDEVYITSADSRHLDKFHPRSGFVVSRFEDIESRSFTIRKLESFVTEFCIFEVVFGRLEMVDLTILRTGDERLEAISQDEDITRKSIFCIRRLGRGDDLSDTR